MNSKTIITSILLGVAMIGVFGILIFNTMHAPDLSEEDNGLSYPPTEQVDVVFYKKESSWGPCGNPDGGCFLNTSVYSSGKVVLESKTTEEKQLTKDEVDNIIKEIRDSGILAKDCDFFGVVDYWATYTINLDNQTKTITFPGCEDEASKIDQMIGVAVGRRSI